MITITSMYDFECKIKLDARYKAVAIYAHQTAGWLDKSGTYEAAHKWIYDWLETDGNKDGCCDVMIDYLNCRLLETREFSRDPYTKRKDVVIPNYGPEFHPCTCGCNLLLNGWGNEAGLNPNHISRRSGA